MAPMPTSPPATTCEMECTLEFHPRHSHQDNQGTHQQRRAQAKISAISVMAAAMIPV